jgi:hypothetical protein
MITALKPQTAAAHGSPANAQTAIPKMQKVIAAHLAMLISLSVVVLLLVDQAQIVAGAPSSGQAERDHRSAIYPVIADACMVDSVCIYRSESSCLQNEPHASDVMGGGSFSHPISKRRLKPRPRQTDSSGVDLLKFAVPSVWPHGKNGVGVFAGEGSLHRGDLSLSRRAGRSPRERSI